MPKQAEKKYTQKSPHSMTGFGRGTAASSQISVHVELKTLNNKFFDIRPKIPKALASWEPNCRNAVSQFVRRGSAEVLVNYQVLDAQLIHPINDAALKAYAVGIEATSKKLGIPSGLNLTALLRLPGALSMDEGMVIGDSDREQIHSLLDEALAAAITELLEMRAREGGAILDFLRRELDNVKKSELEIRALAPRINQRLRERIERRVGEVLKESKVELDEGRLVQELAFYADRSDVTEELDRLASHGKQSSDLLASKKNFVIGKQLDFIVQEMLREANTIGSKADDVSVTNLVVQLKLAIDRMREQVQNLE